MEASGRKIILPLFVAVILLLGVVLSATAQTRPTSTPNISPTELRATAEALNKQADELEAEQQAQIKETQRTNSDRFAITDADGKPLRQPTDEELADMKPIDGAWWDDCDAALAQVDADRFAFVGVCEGTLVSIVDQAFCRDGNIADKVQRDWPDATAVGITLAERQDIWDNMDSEYGGYSLTYNAYSQRLTEEWAKGDVPAKTPLEPEKLLDAVELAGCHFD